MPEYYSSPRWTAEIADCSMPMTFDQYSNCSYRCIYCFASYQRSLGKKGQDYRKGLFKEVNEAHIRRIFDLADDRTTAERQFEDYVRSGKTVQWGGMSDPFCFFERKRQLGLALMRYFREKGTPISFSTKGVWMLDDPRYVEVLTGASNWHFKVSIITLDERKARAIELGVPTPKARLEAIGKLSKMGLGGVTLRLRPFMIGITDPTHPELIQRAADAGAVSMSTEFFCLEQRSKTLRKQLEVFNRLAGFDYFEFYKRYSSGTGYLRLNRNVKRPFVNQMEQAARNAGIRFFISDAHFKERCDTGCCCGLPDSMQTSQGQFTAALLLCKTNGKVTWPEVAADMKHLESVPWIRAEGFNCGGNSSRAKFGGMSMLEYLRYLWNHPMAGQAPYAMFGGIMKPVGKDEQDNLIYAYDPTKE